MSGHCRQYVRRNRNRYVVFCERIFDELSARNRTEVVPPYRPHPGRIPGPRTIHCRNRKGHGVDSERFFAHGRPEGFENRRTPQSQRRTPRDQVRGSGEGRRVPEKLRRKARSDGRIHSQEPFRRNRGYDSVRPRPDPGFFLLAGEEARNAEEVDGNAREEGSRNGRRRH